MIDIANDHCYCLSFQGLLDKWLDKDNIIGHMSIMPENNRIIGNEIISNYVTPINSYMLYLRM